MSLTKSTIKQEMLLQPANSNSYKLQLSVPSNVAANEFLVRLDSSYYAFTPQESTSCPVDYSGCKCSLAIDDSKFKTTEMWLSCVYTGVVPPSVNISISILNSLHITDYPNPTLTSLTAYAIDSHNHIAFDSGKVTSVLPVYPLSLVAYKLLLLWGVEYHENTEFPLGLYAAKPGALGSPANNVRVQFQVNETVPSGVYSLSIALGETSSLLTGSIAHNLPASTGATVRFSMAEQQLRCANMGVLAAATDYFVAFKVYFPATASAK
jgi:hypothetical protein